MTEMCLTVFVLVSKGRQKRKLEWQISEDYKSIFMTHAGGCCGFIAMLHRRAVGHSSLILLSAVQACLLFGCSVTLSSAGFVHAVNNESYDALLETMAFMCYFVNWAHVLCLIFDECNIPKRLQCKMINANFFIISSNAKCTFCIWRTFSCF